MSHDDLDDDLHDPDLSRALGALVPASTDDAFERSLPRFERARRRRRAATTGLAIGAGIVVVVAGIAVTGRSSVFSGVKTVNPAHPGRTAPDRATDGSVNGPKNRNGDRTGPSTTATTTPGVGSSSTTTNGAGGVTSTSTSPTTTTAPSGSHHYSSQGGSIDVQLGNRTVTLTRSTAASGYISDVRLSGPTEVEVRFRQGSSGKSEHMIRLRYDSNRRLIVEIT